MPVLVSHINFPTEIEANGVKIKLANLTESICQGGPTVGDLEINGVSAFTKNKFGGPFFIHKGMLYISELCKSINKGTGFKLAVIDINKLEKKYLSPWEPLILIYSVCNGRIEYFVDTENTYAKTENI